MRTINMTRRKTEFGSRSTSKRVSITPTDTETDLISSRLEGGQAARFLGGSSQVQMRGTRFPDPNVQRKGVTPTE